MGGGRLSSRRQWLGRTLGVAVLAAASPARAQDVATDPDFVTDPFAILPDQWLSLDGTTTVAEDGTWLAVGEWADAWIVTTVGSDPTFTFLGYLPPPEDAAEGQQPPDPFAPNAPKPAPPPPGAPQLPPPPVLDTPRNRIPWGAVGGGILIPDPTAPTDYPLFPRGIVLRVFPGVNGKPPRGVIVIPVFPDGEIILEPLPDGRLKLDVGNMPPWLKRLILRVMFGT